MRLKHKHGYKYGGQKINTSAGLVELDKDGYVENEDDCDLEALLASGNFIDPDAPEPEPEEEVSTIGGIEAPDDSEEDWEDLGPTTEAPKVKKKKKKKKKKSAKKKKKSAKKKKKSKK